MNAKEKDIKVEFAKKLRSLREKKEITQVELAEILGVSRGSISFYENADRAPDIEFIYRAAEYFNVSCDFLTGRSRIAAPDDFIQEVVRRYGLNENSLEQLEKINEAHLLLERDKNEIEKIDDRIKRERSLSEEERLQRDKEIRAKIAEAKKANETPEVPYYLDKDIREKLRYYNRYYEDTYVIAILNDFFKYFLDSNLHRSIGYIIFLVIYQYCYFSHSDIISYEEAPDGTMTEIQTPGEIMLKIDLDNIASLIADFRKKIIEDGE